MIEWKRILNAGPGRVMVSIGFLNGEPYTASYQGQPCSVRAAMEVAQRIGSATPRRAGGWL